MKDGYSFFESIAVDLPALYLYAIMLIGGVWLALTDFLNKNKSKIVDLFRWICFIPIGFLFEEYVVSPVYQFVANTLFFAYPKSVLPFVMSPFILKPITAILSFEFMYVMLPKFKKQVLLILALLSSISGLIGVVELMSSMDSLSHALMDLHNIATILNIILVPLIAYWIIVYIIHDQQPDPVSKKVR